MKKQIIASRPVRLADQRVQKEIVHAGTFLLILEEDMELIKQKAKKHAVAER